MKTGNCNANRKLVFQLLCLFVPLFFSGQNQTYDDFEGVKMINYGARNGVLDTAVANPAPDKINSSQKCALYIRNASKKFDNIKMNLSGNLSDVASYATYSGIPPKLKLKV
ncbi:MAG: hypothetical protein ACJ76F_10590, partial [Bacteroidia bacterium]